MTKTASHNAMPGAFNTYNEPAVGRKAHVFQLPRTPSASSSMHLTRSTASILSEGSDRSTATSRKRTRHDYASESNATPVAITPDWAAGIDTGGLMARSGSIDPGSPMPFVNTRYRIAGGLDTPTAAVAALHEGNESEYSDVGYRRGLSGESRYTGLDDTNNLSYFPRLPDPEPEDILTEANSHTRIPSLPHQSSSGLKLALDVVGGVVGKVWEFCKTGAFRGFQAGGGSAYTIEQSTTSPPTERDFWDGDSEPKVTIFSQRLADEESAPLPGRFPHEDYIADYMDRATPETTPPRSSKRRHVESSEGGLDRNWVIVPAAKPASTRTPISQTRPAARYSIPTASSAGRRLTASTNTRPASRAGTRRPFLPNSRVSGVSHAGSPALRTAQGASFASPRSPGGSKIPVPTNSTMNTPSKSMGNDSPAAIEAQKWAAQKKREEKEADESIRRFNAQLKAMIREGKQALGTKVEVREEEMLDDDGFEVSNF